MMNDKQHHTVLGILREAHPKALSFPTLVEKSGLSPHEVDYWLQDFESRGIVTLDTHPENSADLMMISFNAHATLSITFSLSTLGVSPARKTYYISDIPVDELNVKDMDPELLQEQFLGQLSLFLEEAIQTLGGDDVHPGQ
jgi:hypothetical protein